MISLTKYAIKRPVTVVIGIIIALILGIISFTGLQTDLLPKMNLPYAILITPYQGASPETVENQVSRPLEQSMAGVSNIKNISSISAEHYSVLVLEFNSGTNLDSVESDIRASLNLTTASWSNDISDPIFMKINPNMMPVMSFTISQKGKSTSELVNWYNNTVVPGIEKLPGVASVDVGGIPKEEISITLDQDKIDAYNDSLKTHIESFIGEKRPNFVETYDDVDELTEIYESVALSQSKINSIIIANNHASLAGSVEIGGVEYYVRVGEKLKTIDDISNIEIVPLLAPYFPYSTVKLATVPTSKFGDLSVENGMAIVTVPTKNYYKVNGEDAVTISVNKASDKPTTDVTSAIHKELKAMKKDNPNIEYRILSDQGVYINSSINGIISNLLVGALLAIFILFLFIRNLKINLTIALAIPLSLLVAFVMIYFSGITLNIISMAGLALGVGMLVDNSIIVIENIYLKHHEQGVPMKEAALQGTGEMIGAIIASTLTTVCVFLPIVFVSGLVVSIFRDMALTITFSLLASLIVSIAVVPVMAIHIKDINLGRKKSAADVNKTPVFDRIKNWYGRVLAKALKHRWWVLGGTFLLFFLCAFGVTRINFTLMPSSDEGQINISLTVEEDEEFNQIVARAETYVLALEKSDTEISKYIDEISVSYSEDSSNMSMMSMLGSSGVSIDILLTKNRAKATSHYAQEARDIADKLGYHYEVSESSGMMSMLSTNTISFSVQGQDIEKLEKYATQIGDIMRKTEGITEVDDGTKKNSKELKITLNQTGIAMGLDEQMLWGLVAQQINLTYPNTVITLDGRDYDVKITGLEKATYLDIEEIRNLVVMGFPLSMIADVDYAYGYTSILRENQKRVITISGKPEDGYNSSKLSSTVQKEIDKIKFEEGYGIYQSGDAELITETMTSLITVLALAIALVYLVMAAQFQSFKYPFIVIMTLPLAFTGAFIGLFVTFTPLSAPALIGMIILVGVVVNSGIVLVDSINQNKEKGLSTYDAIIDSSTKRLRPILMTSITTILAMMTMAIGIGSNSEFYQPIGITSVGGLLFATILTLFIVPIFYSMFDRKGMKKETSEVSK